MGKRRDSPDRWPGARPLRSPLALGTLLAVACGTSGAPGNGSGSSADGAAGFTGDGSRAEGLGDAEPGADGGAGAGGTSDAAGSAGGDGSPGGSASDGGREAGSPGGAQDGGTAARTYTTHFPLTENPISEGFELDQRPNDRHRLARRLDHARPGHRTPERQIVHRRDGPPDGRVGADAVRRGDGAHRQPE